MSERRLHPRVRTVSIAEGELLELVVNWSYKHDLTYAEEALCLTGILGRTLHRQLQAERHPDDPTQPANLE